MKRDMLLVSLGPLVVLTVLTASLAAEEGGAATFLERFGDVGWKSRFEEVLLDRLALRKIPVSSLNMVYRMIGDFPIPGEPALAAARVAGMAADFDADLRRGVPVASAMAAYRQNWRVTAAEQARDEDRTEKNAAWREMRERLKEQGLRGRSHAAKTKNAESPAGYQDGGKDDGKGGRQGGKD